jgi:hypothetical protein
MNRAGFNHHRTTKPGKTEVVKRTMQVLVAAGLLPLLWACGRKIGDECKTQYDCNEEDDTKTCDISQPGGYCTIDGCDETSCPEEAVCVRFFPAEMFLTDRCEPGRTSGCDSHELCLDSGWCAPRASEQRRCLLRCGDGGDCREEYECRQSGALNSKAVTTVPATVGFCAPRSR